MFFPQPKPTPRIVSKIQKRRSVVRMDRTEKEKVRQRDRECCRVCGKKTRDVHERLFKSLGGVASLDNSICACRTCHPFLQEHGKLERNTAAALRPYYEKFGLEPVGRARIVVPKGADVPKSKWEGVLA